MSAFFEKNPHFLFLFFVRFVYSSLHGKLLSELHRERIVQKNVFFFFWLSEEAVLASRPKSSS